MSEIDDIVTELTRRTYFLDELDKATYSYNLEQAIINVERQGYIDTTILWELYHLGVRFLNPLARYKGVTDEEAVDLIENKEVLYSDFVSVLKEMSKFNFRSN